MLDSKNKGSLRYLYSIELVAVLGGLLFGYDTAVISGAEKGLQAFFMNADDFVYTNSMHGLTCASALIGCIIGSAVSGFLASHLGRKRSLILAGVFFFVSAIGSMFPEMIFFENDGLPTIHLLNAFVFYRIIGGVGVGLASAICPMYIGEIAPSNLRGMLVSWNQFAIIFGQLLVYFVNFLILGKNSTPVIEMVDGVNQLLNPSESEWITSVGWRYMFGSEGIIAGIFTILIFFIPETPRYLVISGRDAKALSILIRINGQTQGQRILEDIRSSVVIKKEPLFAYGSLCVFVGIMLSVFQQAVGINAVLYYAPRIFQDMGTQSPMIQTVIMGVVNIAFTLLAIFTVEKIGRKPLLIFGSIGMAIGAFGVAATFGNHALNWLCMLSIMIYSASFMFSWGPICWVLISEIFPNTIRSEAVAIAVAFQWIFNWIVSSTFVPMFNMHISSGDNFGHWFTYGLYGVMCVLAAFFVWKLVPETKGKTLEEMNKLWKTTK